MLFASVVGVFGLLLWLFLLLVPIALLIVLQVWLCKKSLKLGLAAFSRINSRGSGGMTLEQNGQVVEQTITENGVTTVYDGEGNIIDQYEEPGAQPEPITTAAVGTVVVLFLVSNIPTVVFGGIWLHYKNRRDFQEDLKKMKIEDLG